MAIEQITPLGDDSQYSEREIWKPVPSEPGVLASSHGRILLPPGYAPLPNGGYRMYTPEPRLGQVAKSSKKAKHQYLNIMVKRYDAHRRQAPRKVHQLVCEAFHGPKPFEKAVVIHKDENALNNRPENLKWGTQKENLNAPGLREYRKSIRGDKHPCTKYPDKLIAEIRARHESGERQIDISESTGLSTWAINEIVHKKRRV